MTRLCAEFRPLAPCRKHPVSLVAPTLAATHPEAVAADRDPLRAVAQYRVDRLLAEDGATRPEQPPGDVPAVRHGIGTDAWAEEAIRRAIARGDFDHLPLAGKPIPGLTRHDPDWWLRSFIEREHITGVGPEAFLLRRDDAELDRRIDEEHSEAGVREVVDEFNARVLQARRQLRGGPPVVTSTRDPDVEVARWRARREPATAGGAVPEGPRRPAPWYRGQFLSRRRRASSPAESSDAR